MVPRRRRECRWAISWCRSTASRSERSPMPGQGFREVPARWSPSPSCAMAARRRGWRSSGSSDSEREARMGKRFVTAQFDRGQKPVITVVNEAKTPWGVAQNALVAALQKYVDERFAPVWGVPATLLSGSAVKKGSWGLVFLDDADQADALGYHDLTPQGLPLGKVFVRTTISSKNLVSVTASHELAEMLADQPSISPPRRRTAPSTRTRSRIQSR